MGTELLGSVLRAALFLLPAVLIAVAIALTPEAPRAVLRAAVGLLAAVGYYEVLLYSAGYTSRPEPAIPLRIPLGSPKSSKLLEAALVFVLLGASFRLLEGAFREDYPLVLASSAVAAYILGRLVRSLLSSGGFAGRLVLVSLALGSLHLFYSDSDFRYLQSLLRLVEEVVRSAL